MASTSTGPPSPPASPPPSARSGAPSGGPSGAQPTHASTRRPLPALIALVALLVLTSLVWWRVLNRNSTGATEQTLKPCPTPTAKVIALPAPSSIYLQVLNSTTRNGIAGRARTALSDAGFQIPGPALNDNRKLLNKIKTVGQIRYGTSSAQAARLVHYYLPGATLVRVKTASKTIVVSLGTTYRGIVSATAVRAALRRDGVVAGTPTPTPGVSPTCATPTSSGSTSPTTTRTSGS